MGQSNSSGFVVEIAPPKLAKGWQVVQDNGNEDENENSEGDNSDSDSDDQQDPYVKTSGRHRYRPITNPRLDASNGRLGQVQSETNKNDNKWEKHQKPWRIIVNPTAEMCTDLGSKTDINANNQQSPGDSKVFEPGSRRCCLNDTTGFSGSQFKANIKATVDRLYGKPKLLTMDEARCIALALDMREPGEPLIRLLTTISTVAQYTANQDTLRQTNVLQQIKRLFSDRTINHPCRVMVMQSMANLAINPVNRALLKDLVPIIIKRCDSDLCSELERMVSVQALTNLSVDIDAKDVQLYKAAVPICFRRLWSHGQLNLAVLRLLCNFACCIHLVPHILAAKAPPGLLCMLERQLPLEMLSVGVTLVHCLYSACDSLSYDYQTDIAPLNVDPFNSQLMTVHFALTGPVGSAELLRKFGPLRYHQNAEIRARAIRLTRLVNKMALEADNEQRNGEVEAGKPGSEKPDSNQVEEEGEKHVDNNTCSAAPATTTTKRDCASNLMQL